MHFTLNDSFISRARIYLLGQIGPKRAIPIALTESFRTVSTGVDVSRKSHN